MGGCVRACVCVCACVRVCVCGRAREYALRIVSMEKSPRFTNTSIIIINVLKTSP